MVRIPAAPPIFPVARERETVTEMMSVLATWCVEETTVWETHFNPLMTAASGDHNISESLD